MNRSIATLLALSCLATPAHGLDGHPAEDEGAQEKVTEEPAEPKAWYRNIIPIPVIITEPAIGEGLGIGVGYFHPDRAPDAYQPKDIETAGTVRDVSVARNPPPTVTGAFGAVTNNGTWAGGVGHMNSWRNDSIRYLGVAAYANVVTDLYVFDQPFEFELKGLIVYQDAKFRLGESNWFLGAALMYLDGNSTFRVDPPSPSEAGAFGDGFLAQEFSDVGLTGRLMYESRDDSMMPSTGQLLDLSVTQNSEALGGDYDYTTVELKFLSFHRLGQRFVLGLRAEYSMVGNDPPFYGIPWVTLRGIPAMRYQGEQVAVVEAELRFDFNENWAAVGFFGKGWVDTRLPGLGTLQDIDSHGFGARWRALKAQNVWVGLDLAKGPEESVVYVQVGHPW
jgi:hypothetical protein